MDKQTTQQLIDDLKAIIEAQHEAIDHLSRAMSVALEENNMTIYRELKAAYALMKRITE